MADEVSFIPTRSAQLKKEAADSFQCIVYESYKNKGGKNSERGDKEKNSGDHRKEMDMKKVRYEVFKFGMSGFAPQKKEEAKVALAVKLGAKPPKNPYHNYKEFKDIKQKQREDEAEENRLLNAGKSTVLIDKRKRQVALSKRKSKDGILDPYGKPGKVSLGSKRRKKHV